MVKHLNLGALIASIVIAVAATACAKTSTKDSVTTDNEAVDLELALHKVAPEFNGKTTCFGNEMDYTYTVADTAAVNEAISERTPEVDYRCVWSEPNTDGYIAMLVAYETKPIFTDKATVIAATPVPSSDKFINLGLQCNDVKGLDTATSYNVGHNLALTINGKFIDAPQVLQPIENGGLRVPVPIEKLNEYFPNIDLEKLLKK